MGSDQEVLVVVIDGTKPRTRMRTSLLRNLLQNIWQVIPHSSVDLSIQRSAKRWALGCVNPTSWLPLATGREFTQPRAHLIAQGWDSRLS